MAQDPTISPKRPQVNQPQPALQSTPQAKGSATISEHISTVGVQVSEIRPWITRDIEKSAQYSIDEMLKDLADCTDKSPESLDDASKPSLFEKCREGVLPICNVEPVPVKDFNAKSYQVRENLLAYSTTQVETEKELYPLFVKAANTALLFLDELDMEHIRPTDKSAVCFHVHDPALLTQRQIVGVLTDFDLASTQDTVTGTDRTGTVPFMAVALLEDEALLGAIRHMYEHEAESFIWVLVWITLRYDSGKLRELTRGRPLDEWPTLSAAQCTEKKTNFLRARLPWILEAGKGHEDNWKLAQECIIALINRTHSIAASRHSLPSLDVDTAFKTLLKAPIATGPYLLPGL